jgi:hypothetical protein
MCFPPRCYYCRSRIRWPFGLSIFRGWTGLHVAHRSCSVSAQWSRGQGNAFTSDDGRQKPSLVIFPLRLPRRRVRHERQEGS